MKHKLSKILSFILLLSFAIETTGSLWVKQTVSTELTDKDEKGKSGEPETEKQDSKDKTITHLLICKEISTSCTLYVAANTFIKYAGWLSLPDIPPKIA